MKHEYYSQRIGENKNIDGLPLEDIEGLFLKLYDQLREDGYFDESFGWYCGDLGYTTGLLRDIEMEVLLTIRKKDLWPMDRWIENYSEDDLFDVMEFLYQHVSKPVDGSYHSYHAHTHWESFDKIEGQETFRAKVNDILNVYRNRFELSARGEILRRPEAGFERIFEADIPAKDKNIVERIDAATYGIVVMDRRLTIDDKLSETWPMCWNTFGLGCRNSLRTRMKATFSTSRTISEFAITTTSNGQITTQQSG